MAPIADANHAELLRVEDAGPAEEAGPDNAPRPTLDPARQLALILHHAVAGAWDLDILGDRAVWSAEMFALRGVDPAGAAPGSRLWLDTMLDEDRAPAAAAMRSCLSGERAELHVDFRIVHPHRGVRWLSGRGTVSYTADGRPARLTGVDLDVTDCKLAEARLANLTADLQRRVEQEVALREAAVSRLYRAQKMEAIGELTGGIAHDFNNLLTVVSGGLFLLPAAAADPERRDRLIGRMNGAIGRGAQVTQRLLAFARRQILQPVAINLQDRLAALPAILTPALRPGIRLELCFEPDLWPLFADAAAFDLTLLNVATNARDAMPQGGLFRLVARNLTLGATAAEILTVRPGNYVEIACADTGLGMQPDVMLRVFEPFFTTKPVGQGTGLGLPQVDGFASQSGGAVRVESRVGQGTTVILLLPCAPSSAALPHGR